MFIFRWLKRLVLLVLVVAGILYIVDYKWDGKPFKQHVSEAYKSGMISEAIKDIRTWIADLFKASKKVGDEITDKDKKALEDVLSGSLTDNIKKLKEEAAKMAAEKTSEEGKDTKETKTK